ncbi:MAG: hypothetical protein CMP58_03615 [Flavobacteriales bacterium]|nr:hypothetical protein [Flavobacteriales bacterium]
MARHPVAAAADPHAAAHGRRGLRLLAHPPPGRDEAPHVHRAEGGAGLRSVDRGGGGGGADDRGGAGEGRGDLGPLLWPRQDDALGHSPYDL